MQQRQQSSSSANGCGSGVSQALGILGGGFLSAQTPVHTHTHTDEHTSECLYIRCGSFVVVAVGAAVDTFDIPKNEVFAFPHSFLSAFM